jgi:hypothetical protein
MADKIDIKAIIKRLATIEAQAAGVQLECQQTRKLLEAADVSTSTNENRMSQIALDARTRLRSKLFK